MSVCLPEQWPAIVQSVAAIAQAVTAVIIVVLTVRLVAATKTYAALTKSAVDLSAKQYEADVTPMWHLTLHAAESEGNEVWLKTFNLSKNSARVTHLLIRAESEHQQETRQFILNLGMPGEYQVTTEVRQFILQSAEPFLAGHEWTGVLEIALVFTPANSPAQIPSERFLFKVIIRQGRIISVQPRLPGISVEPIRGNPQ